MNEAGSNRPSEVAQLRHLLESPQRGLNICSISGPGGVGKSFLLSHVLADFELGAAGYVHLSVNAANIEARSDFFAVLEQLFRRSLPPPADPKKDYFPHLRRVAQLHREVIERASAELKKSGVPDLVRDSVLALLKAGHVLNAAVPNGSRHLKVASGRLTGWLGAAAKVGQVALQGAQALDEEDVERALDFAWKQARELKSLTEGVGRLRQILGFADQDRVRRELFAFTAEQLVTDLSAAIGGYQAKDRLTFLHGQIDGAKRLLLVIDDYEILSPLLSEFLVGAFVPRLAAAGFDTVMVVLCRDDLEATHEGWAQHSKQYLRPPVKLSAFDEPTATQLLAQAGVPEERRRALYEATQGYPFLLTLAIEEAGAAGADSALFLRKFFDRTTRWMSPREREWFERICYLERVDEDTLGPLFPGEDVGKIVDWFEREPSIRDPSTAFWRVRPLVREKVLRYLEVRAPSKHRERLALAGSR
ncbi:MAG: hypothetical protein Q8N23_10435 [Archangium sp.]|nr:hypothetical protein [Archangium sp.]MDP3153078.1 hypothetical protein [Archangium sp.]MDP3572535.1 hypothetical protein [Archangium sp.]